MLPLLLLASSAIARPLDPSQLAEELAGCASGDREACIQAGRAYATLGARDRHDEGAREVWANAHARVVRALCDAGDAEACSAVFQWSRSCALDPRWCLRPPHDVPVLPPLEHVEEGTFSQSPDGNVVRWAHGRLLFDEPLIEGANRAAPLGDGWVFYRSGGSMPRFAVVQPDGTRVVELQLEPAHALCEVWTVGDTHLLTRLTTDGRCGLGAPLGLVSLVDGEIEGLTVGTKASLAGAWLATRARGGDEVVLRHLGEGTRSTVPLPDGADEASLRVSDDGGLALQGEGRVWVRVGSGWVERAARAVTWVGDELLAVETGGRLPEHGRAAKELAENSRNEWGVVYGIEGEELRPLRARPLTGWAREDGVPWSEQAYSGRWTGRGTLMTLASPTVRVPADWVDPDIHGASLVRGEAPARRTVVVLGPDGAPMSGVQVGDHRSDDAGELRLAAQESMLGCAWVDGRCRAMRTDRDGLRVGPPPMDVVRPDGADELWQLDAHGLSAADATRLEDGRWRVRWVGEVQAFVARSDDGWFVAEPGSDGEMRALPSTRRTVTDVDGFALVGLPVEAEVPGLGTVGGTTDLLGSVVLPSDAINVRLLRQRPALAAISGIRGAAVEPLSAEGDRWVWPHRAGPAVGGAGPAATHEGLLGRWEVEDGTPNAVEVLKNGKLLMAFGRDVLMYNMDGFRYGTVIGYDQLDEGFEDMDITRDEEGRIWILTDTGYVHKFKNIKKKEWSLKVIDRPITHPRMAVNQGIVFIVSDDQIERIDAYQLKIDKEAADAEAARGASE